MEMPRPSEGHTLFEFLAGTWVGEERMYPLQWDPQGGSAVGRNTSRVVAGGFGLVTDYEQERDGVITFRGHGVYSYDPGQDTYSLYWLDSMGSPPEAFTGQLRDRVLVLGHGGPPMHVRLTWDLREEGQIGSRMEMSSDGAEWQKLFDAVNHRT